MNVKIRIYKLVKQSRKGEFNRPESFTQKSIFETSYTVSEKLPFAAQLAKCVQYATWVLGCRYAAAVEADISSATKQFFEIDFGSEVYRSETSLASAQYTDLIKISTSKLAKLPEVRERIKEVQTRQINGMKIAANFMKNLSEFEEGKTEIPEVVLQGLKVSPEGNLQEEKVTNLQIEKAKN